MKSFLRQFAVKINKMILPKQSGRIAYEYIVDALTSDAPVMIARLGAVEIKAVLYSILPPPCNIILRNYVYSTLHTNAGFFPVEEKQIKKFGRLMIDSMKWVDILASWRPEEIFFKRVLRNSKKISLADLSPSVDLSWNWSSVLKDKKILVIHPFADTIETQYYTNRNKLFPGTDILPEFKALRTIKAVQTIAGNTSGYSSWFDALYYMEHEIDRIDFDIALLGCGAYGFPLAAYIKKIGKKAVHIGGALQLYFGIKGKRFEDMGLYNDYWISPSLKERPVNADKVENGCYW